MKNVSPAVYLTVFAIFLFGAIVALGIVKGNTPSVHTSFAQCLTENGYTMYGAWWCPHCENQKREFGNAFEHVNYIECSDPGQRAMNATCQEAGVEAYPEWRNSDDEKIEQPTLQKLSQVSGCPLPGDEPAGEIGQSETE